MSRDRPSFTQKYHSSEEKQSLFGKKWFLAVWVLVCLGLSITLWQSVASLRANFDRASQAEKQVKHEEDVGLTLIEKLKEADTDFSKEKIIRDELGLQKPGEVILQVAQDGTVSASPTP
jgi:hypothetical protein